VSPVLAADPGVTLIGTGFIPGNAFDRSGLEGMVICSLDAPGTCTDQATLGAFGSAMTYTGHDNVFIAANDRGTFDGRNTVPYLTRFHFFHMIVKPGAPFPNVEATLLDTRFLKNEVNATFVGDASAFDTVDPLKTLRLDPEGVPPARSSCRTNMGPTCLSSIARGTCCVDCPCRTSSSSPTRAATWPTGRRWS
jgi:hypothetical protein